MAELSKDVVNVLRKTTLFRGVSPDEIVAMSGCLNARVRHFLQEETILRVGDTVNDLGIVISGTIHIIRDGYWGDENLVNVFSVGDVFAENFACMNDVTLDVNVVAAEDTTVVFLDVHKVAHTCSSTCPFHSRLLDNLVSEIAHKNLILSRKMSYITQRTTRKKVMAYLSAVAMEKSSSTFDIPMNRQQLADFLAVDRSALSTTLSNLQSEGILRFSRNHFELLQDI